MHNYGELENCPFRIPFSIKKKASREQLLQKIHKNGQRTKDLKNNDTSRSSPPKDIIYCRQTKVNSVLFEDPYEQINPTDNTNDKTHLIDVHEEHIKEDSE